METMVIVSWAGGGMDARIQRRPDGTATVETKILGDDKWEDMGEYDSPRQAMMHVMGLFGW